MQIKVNQAAFEVGQMSERMAQGYFGHLASLQVASHPGAKQLVPAIEPGNPVPVGSVSRKDGTQYVFHFTHYLEQAHTDPVLVREVVRIWLVGSLLGVGDALGQYDYFDHAPELELLYHLRNGVAHGNKFNLSKGGAKRLNKYPAHNKLAWIKSDTKAVFEIEPSLHGKEVLFDYMGPGDVLDVLQSVGLYLIRMGNGDPLRP